MEIKKMYINGEWCLSSSNETINIINPANGKEIAKITKGTRKDVDSSAQAAYKAFYEDGWNKSLPSKRRDMLLSVARKLEERKEEFAKLETLNNGKLLKESIFDVEDSIECFKYYAGIIDKPTGEVYEVGEDTQSFTVREPIGVCSLIVPWNYPLSMAVWKIAPALAGGNCILFKPSEVTPLTSIKLFEIFDEVGFPKGVVNLLLGLGSDVGDEMVTNSLVHKISFTGGTATGKEIMRAGSEGVKNVSLELGGKSPNIVFSDCDIDLSVDYALYAIFFNQGQVCAAGSRLLLQESIYDEFIEKLVSRTKKIKLGVGGESEDCDMGPLVSKSHMEKVLKYIEIGKEEGASVLTGGKRSNRKDLKDGYFVEPTIFTNTTEDMKIVKEEIFGPVLVIQTFKNEQDAIMKANNSDYGLAAGVFTKDGAKALRVIKQLRAGITWINTYHSAYCQAPWGGYKQSGVGRELGSYGLEEYTQVKQININLNPVPIKWFK